MTSRALLPPLALSAALLAPAAAAAQGAVPLLLRYQGLIEGASLEEGAELPCALSLIPVGATEAAFSEQVVAPVVESRFVVTLGANSANPLSPELFRQQLNLKVECDLDSSTPGAELSVTEPVGHTPRAVEANRARAVEGPVVATELRVGQGDAARLVVDAQGSWVGAPIIPRYNDQPLVVEGAWVGAVDAPLARAARLVGEVLDVSVDVLSPAAHVERVYLRALYYDSAPGELDDLLVNEAREWVGGVNVAAARLGAAQASSLAVSGALDAEALSARSVVAREAVSAASVAVTGAVVAAAVQADAVQADAVQADAVQADSVRADSVRADSVRADAATLGALTHDAGGAVLSAAGRLVAPLDPQDADADGFSDLVEALLGADVADAASRPEDLNDNGMADALEGVSPASADLAEVFSRRFEVAATAAALNADPGSGAPWLAAEVDLRGEGAVTSADVEVSLTLTNRATGLPARPELLTLTLRTPEGVDVPLHEGAAAFAGRYTDAAPPSAAWARLSSAPVSGFWQLIAQTPAGVRVDVSRFQVRLGYTSATRVAVGADLDLGAARRLSGLAAPARADDATPRFYVDAQVQASAAAVTAQVTADLRAQLADDLDAQRAALDVRYPTALQYRHRLFYPVHPRTGQPNLNNDAALAGGVSPTLWLSNLTAGNLSLSDLGALVTERGQGAGSALLALRHDRFAQASATVFSVVHFEVENLTDGVIEWDLSVLASCDLLGGQPSSLSLNGVDLWVTTLLSGDPTCQTPHSATVTLPLPPNAKSDVVLLGAAGPQDGAGERALQLAITQGTLALPAGLRFVASWAR